MKKIFLLPLLFFASIGGVFANEKPSVSLKQNFLSDYELLLDASHLLVTQTEFDHIDWQETAAQFFKTRLAYKNIALFMAYLDREFVNDHINGAPLPRIERKAPNLIVFDPVGFQTMEEALSAQNFSLFASLSKKLDKKLNEFHKRLPSAQISERMIFELLREELVRFAALEMVGFESPMEINVIPECKTIVSAIKSITMAYTTYYSTEDALYLNNLFSIAENYLNEATFLTLDRFGFIRDFINPLYKKLLHLQKELHIATKELLSETEFSVNYNAQNLFDTDFLNYKYFSKYSNAGNETEKKVLGKLLFFDPILSKNNERACASCHHPDKAFSDGLAKSVSFNGKTSLQRNSPGLINVIYNTRFFWDLRASTPEDQIEHVLFNKNEFNTNYAELVVKLESCQEYVDRFKDAYPESQDSRANGINRYTIVASISAYLQSLRSFNSHFDQNIKNKKNTDAKLVKGFNVFTGKGKCATCHFIPTFAGNVPPLYTETETEILGIPSINDRKTAILDADLGRYENGRPKEQAEHYKNAFKTPSIRNIALTAPYMHNGVFETLNQVVDYYNIGGGHGWGIAPENTTLSADSLNLTEIEIAALIYFMESLTDTTNLVGKPQKLPFSKQKDLNIRKIGGIY